MTAETHFPMVTNYGKKFKVMDREGEREEAGEEGEREKEKVEEGRSNGGKRR